MHITIIKPCFDLLNVLYNHFSAQTGSMTIIEEDEVGVNEKPEDTRYIKKITSIEDPKHWECAQRTGCQLCHYWDCGLGKVQVCPPEGT